MAINDVPRCEHIALKAVNKDRSGAPKSNDTLDGQNVRPSCGGREIRNRTRCGKFGQHQSQDVEKVGSVLSLIRSGKSDGLFDKKVS